MNVNEAGTERRENRRLVLALFFISFVELFSGEIGITCDTTFEPKAVKKDGNAREHQRRRIAKAHAQR